MLISTPVFTFLSLSLSLSLSLAAPVAEHLAPLHRRAVDGGRNNPSGGYIVSIKPNTVDPKNRLQWLTKVLTAQNLTLDEDARQSLKYKWSEDVFNGIAGIFSTDALDVLRRQPEVAWVEEDAEVHTALVQQSDAPWGLARLSNGRTRLANRNTDSREFKYTIGNSTGRDTDAYILDTGCRVTHQDFGGRASCFPRDVSCEDRVGHGTHVAGIVGGTAYGVAKEASLYCVKVFKNDVDALLSDVITGVNVTVSQAVATRRPSVISMSLSFDASPSVDDAVSNAIKQGIPVVASAGNLSEDANNRSPGRVREAITVGATTIDDTFASFSNFGDRVDILAPGEDILSASNISDTAFAKISGTSQAAPHVSGLILSLMGTAGKLSPDVLAQQLTLNAALNITTDVPAGTINALANIEVVN